MSEVSDHFRTQRFVLHANSPVPRTFAVSCPLRLARPTDTLVAPLPAPYSLRGSPSSPRGCEGTAGADVPAPLVPATGGGWEIRPTRWPALACRRLQFRREHLDELPTGLAPRSPSPRLRTETASFSCSRSPTTSRYGIFCISPSRILACIRAARSSTSTRTPGRFQPRDDGVRVLVVPVGDGQHLHLHRRQPDREGPRVVLDQAADEALHASRAARGAP